MSTKLPPIQKASLYKLDLASERIQSLKAKNTLEEIISSIVALYDAHVEESNRFKDPLPVDVTKWSALTTKGLMIRWYVSVRQVALSGAAASLQALSAGNLPKLGTVTEHHLIFLYKRFKLNKTAEKTQKYINVIFVLATDKAYFVIKDFADCGFPRDLVARVCKPIYTDKNKMNLSGSSLATSDIYKKKIPFRYSALESLSEYVKKFSTELKKETSLYQLEAFKPFVKKDKEKETHLPVKILVGEMHVKFNHSFSVDEHAEICHQIVTIQTMESEGDEVDTAFEYLDHVKKIPKENTGLLDVLNQLLIQKAFDLFQGKTSPSLDFYHHHYVEYYAASEYRLRKKGAKNALATWTVAPSAQEVIRAFKKVIKSSSLVLFYHQLKDYVFDFDSGKKRKSAHPLATFFKGEVQHEGKAFFYLDGTWCQVEGEYYSFIQNEFLMAMKPAFRSKEEDYLPLPWVSDVSWYLFSMQELERVYKGKEPWKTLEVALLKARYCYLDDDDLIQDIPFGRDIKSEELFQKKDDSFFRSLGHYKGKKLSGSILVDKLGVDSVKQGKEYVETLEELRPFVVKQDGKFLVKQDPECLPQTLKDQLGEAVLERLSLYWKRYENYRGKEEGYCRNYLFSSYNEDGKPFGTEEGYLVFDQVFAGEEQKVELFDVAYYTKDETFLIHIKKGLDQHARDLGSQIRTAAAVLENARKIGGNSDILDAIFEEVMSQKSTSSFRRSVKKQLLSFGKNKKDAKAHFLSLFKGRPLTFVFAFSDAAETERFLETELEREFHFTEEKFDNDDCRKYRGKSILSAKSILEGLQQEGYLDKEERLTDKFIKINKIDAFQPKFLGGKKKNAEAICRVMRSGLSQFSSFIAKKEILDTKKEVESRDTFRFQIWQVHRDGEASATSFQIPDTGDFSSPLPITYKLHETFRFHKQFYGRMKTVGDGACALHALVGEETEEGLLFCAKDKNPQKAAKLDYLGKLEEVLEEDENVSDKLRLFFENLLKEAFREEPLNEAKALFCKHFPIEEWKAEEAQLKDDRKVKLEARNDALWSYITSLEEAGEDLELEDYCIILRTYDKEWSELKWSELVDAIEERGVDNVITALWDELFNSTESGIADILGNVVVDFIAINDLVQGFKRQKIDDYYEQIFEKYKIEAPNSFYYISTQELEIAAIIYDIKAVLLSCDGTGVIHKKHPTLLNCDSKDEAEIVIINDPGHFSRCQLIPN